MKPLRLMMKAFGSYAEETVVDFTLLDDSLFLITGDTGAGKTTIFDAMVYALYGEASGNERDPRLFHSDYVPKTEDCVVELDFEHNKQFYKVRRTIHIPVRRDGTYDDAKQKAVLYEAGKNPIEVPNKVNARINEVIGLNAEQFKQIIVLPQGEFEQFLNSNSEERNKILGKLFDNRPYLRFQSRFKEASTIINNQLKELNEAIEFKINDFKLPEDEDEINYLRSNPNYLNNISLLLDKEKSEFKNIENDINVKTKTKSNLEIDVVKAENNNKELDELDKFKEEFSYTYKSKDVMNNLYLRLNKLRKANAILPLKKAYEEAFKKEQDNYDKTINAKNNADKAKIDADKAVEEFNKCKELNIQINKLTVEKNELTKKLDDFKPFKEKKCEYLKNERLLNVIEKEIDLLTKTCETDFNNRDIKTKRIKEIQEEANLYEYYKAEEKSFLDNTYNKLIGEDGVINRINKINEEEKLLEDFKKEALKLNIELQDKKKRYDEFYETFLKSQAALLSKELKIELGEKEEIDCPVCHHHLTKDDVDKLVIIEEDIVTKDIVDEAYNDFQLASKAYNEKTKDVETKIDAIDTLKQDTCFLAITIGLDVYNYEDIDDAKIEEFKEYCVEKIKINRKNLDLSLSYQKEIKNLNIELDKININLKTNETTLNKKNSEASDLKTTLAGLKTELLALKKTVDVKSENDIKNEIINIDKSIKANIIEIDRLTKNKDDLCNKYSGYIAEYNTLKNNITSLKKECQDKKDEYTNTLKANHFTEDGFMEVFDGIEYDVDEWLEDKQKEFDEYKLKLETQKKRLNEQEDKCKGKSYIDINVIKAKISTVVKEIADTNLLRDAKKIMIDNHQTILDFVKAKQVEIDKLDPVSKRLNKLSILANASENNEGGKITFDRYVMASAFVEILEAANIHLSTMASGQFELVHQATETSKNAQAGLGIEVLDVFTGEKRQPKSLSGGEKFQVSMALALGLSDVSERHAGGKKIDTMYIDEGFGTLDENALNSAINILKNIAGDNRQIGIISHVDKLEECIPQKIEVKRSSKGSKLRIIK